MTETKVIVFDMDGTIADLYGVSGWLEMLRAENPKPYKITLTLVTLSSSSTFLLPLSSISTSDSVSERASE